MVETKLYAEFVGPTPGDVKLQKALQRQLCQLPHLRRTRLIPKYSFSILPWSMEELPGTSWRNAHTACLITVQQLAENRWGKVGPDPGEYGGMFSIGLWRDGQFCIEHWVRVDHLSPEIQIEWAKERVAYCRSQLLIAQEEFNEAKRKGRGISYRKHTVEWKNATLEQAREELAALSKKLGVGDTTDILNIGIQSGEQMRMF